ncbi:MAG: hypothetical protein JWP64_2101 [Pseudonocardia sp.]|jgi:hypothetical protein|uniref:hypothetical protein n=1 Tax=Pseudonocardia sp. TaxID=60912 RepID=UPI00260F1E4B|nr:hypothetical protein [Pseudonocardia sp.]MCU1627152.1 hypothetical protein [Pseudonocardia sp.]MDT7698096.1 hypothetical protein [Pseudonocardiales bacterium]
MSSENEPAEQVAAPAARRRRPSKRWSIGGGAVLAVLILGGVVAALVIPGGGHGRGGPRGGDVGLTAAEDDLGGSDLLGTGPGEDRRGGGRDRDTRGTGDDTLLVGVVKSTASGSLVVTRDGGGDVTVRTDDRTRVRGTATALADLTAGERVVVRVTGTGDTATAVAVQAPKARLTGTVTALTGDRATVVEAGGLTGTVDVSGLTDKPAVGTLALFTGTPTENGTVLKAETSRTLPVTP